jgi:putative nucleotidyltransferase with HDIG domain
MDWAGAAQEPAREPLRILFVDDDVDELDDLRELLQFKRGEWTTAFAVGGVAALEELSRERFDVIVSDMRMPGMNGAELLKLVHDRHPQVVRLMLSGQSEDDRRAGVVPFAHQFLAKPCQPVELERVIERACGLRSLLADVEAQATAAGVISLPSAPESYLRLAEALERPDVSAADVARLIEGDIAVFAKVLQLVNSAFFGLGRRITSANEAVAYLGISALRSLVLSVEVMRTFTVLRPIAGFSIEHLEHHSMSVARTAGRLVRSTKEAEYAFTAGLLHDVGKLVLASEQPARLEALLAEARATGRPLHEVEREQTGSTHAELGAYLLGLWGLPFQVVDAIARHHDPSAVAQPALDVTGALALTEALVGELDTNPLNRGTAPVVAEALLAAVPSTVDLVRSRLVVGEEFERTIELPEAA